MVIVFRDREVLAKADLSEFKFGYRGEVYKADCGEHFLEGKF